MQVCAAGGAQPGEQRLAHEGVGEHERVWCFRRLAQQTGGGCRLERVKSCGGVVDAAGTVDDIGPEFGAGHGGSAQRLHAVATQTIETALEHFPHAGGNFHRVVAELSQHLLDEIRHAASAFGKVGDDGI